MHTQRSAIAAAIVALPLLTGCALFQATTASNVYSTKIDQNRKLTLYEFWGYNAITDDPEFNYSELSLALEGDSNIILREQVARVHRPKADQTKNHGRFDLGCLEARVSTDRERLWIVDRDNAIVICAIDLNRATVVGKDQMLPFWATPSGGVRLEPTGGEKACKTESTALGQTSRTTATPTQQTQDPYWPHPSPL